jgi:hypothetical protein
MGSRMILGTADLWKTAESHAGREAEGTSGTSPTYTPTLHHYRDGGRERCE